MPMNKLMAKEFIIYPNRLISLIIESKRHEAAAIVELKKMQRHYDKLIEQHKESARYIRQLEDEYMKNHTSMGNHTNDYNTFGESKFKSEMNILDESRREDPQDSFKDLQAVYERRVKELESQVEDYRHKEQERLNELISHNFIKTKELKEQLYDSSDDNFTKAAMDAIAILSYELCEAEVKENSKKVSLTGSQCDQSFMAMQSHRSLAPTSFPELVNTSVEVCQRVVIKYLSKTLSRLLTNNPNVCIESNESFIPNNEGDRAVWYLELLESQLDITDKTLRALKEFTEKIAIQITGSVSSAAQVKATSLELASNTKITAQEVMQMRNIVKLITADLEGLRQGVHREAHMEYGNEETLLRAHDNSVNLSLPHNNVFEVSQADKLKTKVNELQKDRENLQNQLYEIQSCFGEKVEPGSLKAKIQEVTLKSQQLLLENDDIGYKMQKIQTEKDKLEKM